MGWLWSLFEVVGWLLLAWLVFVLLVIGFLLVRSYIVSIHNYLVGVRNVYILGSMLGKMLNLDPIERNQHGTSWQEYRGYLIRKWTEQNELLRWRILRHFNVHVDLTPNEAAALEQFILNIQFPINAATVTSWEFIRRFPFFIKKVETILSFHPPSLVRPIVASGVPLEFVRDVERLGLIRRNILSLRV